MALPLSRCVSVFLVGFVCCAGLFAKPKHAKANADNAQDEIEVVAHIVLPDPNITRFFTTQHYRRNYLYAEHELGKTVTLIDVTKLDKPTVVADVAYPEGGNENLVAVAGNAALTASGSSSAAKQSGQTFRIMSLADPLHAVVKQQFAGVTAMSRDEKRGLIFLANDQGLWILQQHYAADPQLEKEWEHMALDNR